MLNEVRICFIFIGSIQFCFGFDLLSSVTRNRADQPIRPSACARQYPERHIVQLAGVYANGTLVVPLFGGHTRVVLRRLDALFRQEYDSDAGQHEQSQQRQAKQQAGKNHKNDPHSLETKALSNRRN